MTFNPNRFDTPAQRQQRRARKAAGPGTKAERRAARARTQRNHQLFVRYVNGEITKDEWHERMEG